MNSNEVQLWLKFLLPVSPGLIPDIHNDGLKVLRVPDELVQEAHAQGPRPDDQVVCCQISHREDNIVVSLYHFLVSGLETN